MVRERSQEEARACFAQAQSLVKNHNYLSAEVELCSAVKLDPERVEYYLLLVECYIKLKKLNKAEESAISGVSIAPKDQIMQLKYAEVLFARNKLLECRQYVLKLLSGGKSSEKLYEILGDVYLNTKDYQAAINCFSSALHSNFDEARITYKIACVHMKLSQYNIAEEYFRKAVKLNSENINFVRSLVNNLILQEKYDEARLTAISALNYFVDDPHLYFLAGKACFKSKNIDTAIPLIQAAITYDPLVANFYLVLADCFCRQAQHDNAIEVLQMALNNGLNRPDVFIRLATNLIKLNRLTEAESILLKNLNISENECNSCKIFAELLCLQGNIKKACEELKIGISNDPRNISLYNELARCLSLLGDAFGAELVRDKANSFKMSIHAR